MRSTLIQYRARAQQLLAFDGMQYGACRPTDLDLTMDWAGDTFIFVELKSMDASLPVGQKRHLEGLVDAITAGGKHAYAIWASHNTPETDTDVHCAQATVVSVYEGDKWVKQVPLKGELKLDTLLHFLHSEHLERRRNK